MIVRFAIWALLTVAMFGTLAYAEPVTTKQAYAQWIDENSDKTVTPAVAKTIVDAAFKHAKEANIDPVVVLAIIKAESGYRPKVGNKYGARGLMQVVPKFHEKKIANRNILGIATNIEVGIKILNGCLKKSKDNLNTAMHCYSGGAGSKYMKNIRNAHRGLINADIKMRFMNELPIKQPNSWGMVRLETQERIYMASNLNTSG